MAAVPQRTLNWLYSVLIRDHYDSRQTYQDPNRTYYDVANALAQYPSLSPRTDVYTYENGFSALLLQLYGTVPVTFRGTVYKFPIALWVPSTYPREPPMVYVTPTQDMVVRVGQHVTLEGRVYHHYLAHWVDAWERSSIADLLSILREVFAKEPPVKYKQPPPAQVQTPPPRPPLPPELGPPVNRPPSTQNSPAPVAVAPVPPPPPPKPGQTPPAQPTPPAGQYSSPPPVPPLPPKEHGQQAGGATPQYAPPEAAAGAYHPQQQYAAQSATFAPRPVHSRIPSGAPTSPIPHQHLPQQYPYHLQQAPPPVTQPSGWPQHQAPPHQQPPHTGAAPAPPKPKDSTPDLLTSPFEVSLPSIAPSGPAPPIPPNPEKDALLHAVSQTLAETLQTNTSQSESAAISLTSQSQSLLSAFATLQSELASLTQLNSTLESNTSVLTQSLHRADAIIADAQSRFSAETAPAAASASISISDPVAGSSGSGPLSSPPIDEILVAPTVVGKQLYDLVADERGTQAAIYALQAALVKGVITVESWSRLTRGLAREAFLKRALVRRIGRGMGLEEV